MNTLPSERIHGGSDFIFERDRSVWRRYDIGEGQHSFTICVPDRFTKHLSSEGAIFGLEVYRSIVECVSIKNFKYSNAGVISGAQKLIGDWYGFKSNDVESPRKETVRSLYDYTPDPARYIGVFFSAGVDSSFTLSWLRNNFEGRIIALSIIHTSDGTPDHVQYPLYQSFSEELKSHDIEHVFVSTNIMTKNPRVNDLWAYATHAACISAIGHLLSKEVNRWFVSSTYDHSNLMPWGSHPLLDPLYSSEGTSILHFGAEFSRYSKIVNLVERGIVFERLSVCGRGPQPGKRINCSRCQKCLRTMIALDLCGAKERAESFDWDEYSPSLFGKVRLSGRNEITFARELYSQACRMNRQDICNAIEAAIQRSRIHRLLHQLELAIRVRFPQILRFKPHLKRMKGVLYR